MTCPLLRLLLRSPAAERSMLVRKRVVLAQVSEITYLASTHPPIQGCIMDVCAILYYDLTASLRGRQGQRTSTSFLLRASLALSSIGVNPASFAHRCALLVLPIPGGPVIITPRKLFIPFLPGFLKLAFKLPDLEDVVSGLCGTDRKTWKFTSH